MNHADLQLVRDHIKTAMPQIERPPAGKILHPWLSVTYGDYYVSTIFTWDFHHAAMRFAVEGKPQYLRFFIENLLAYQQNDGQTPHLIHIDRGPRFLDVPSHAQPFLLQAACLYVHFTGDTAWGASVMDKLTKYVNYYDKAYTGAFGLKRWRISWNGGLDNEVVNAFMPPDTIASADINGFVYIELLAGEKLARRLGQTQLADAFAQRAKAHRDIVNRKLWHGAMQTYSAFNLTDDAPFFRLSFDDVPTAVGQYAFQSCSNLVPLYARMADDDAARTMIERYVIHEDHFWSPHGIRSLSRSSEYFNNAVMGNPSRFADPRRMVESNCQGPVWMFNNYFVFHALRHYGFTDEARTLADRVVHLMADAVRTHGSFAENYHSETGEPLYASCYASWNLLADTLHDDLVADNWIMNPIFQQA